MTEENWVSLRQGHLWHLSSTQRGLRTACGKLLDYPLFADTTWWIRPVDVKLIGCGNCRRSRAWRRMLVDLNLPDAREGLTPRASR